MCIPQLYFVRVVITDDWKSLAYLTSQGKAEKRVDRLALNVS